MEKSKAQRGSIESLYKPIGSLAHSRVFRLFMEGKFGAYVVNFGPKGLKLNSRPV